MYRWLFILLASQAALAAEVVSFTETQRFIGVSHPQLRQWQMNDNVCVLQSQREIACGLVVKTTEKIGVVKIDSRTAKVRRGDRVELASIDRKPTAVLLDEVPGDKNARKVYYNLSGGISFGFNYFFPMLNFQRLISHQFTIGLVPLFFRGAADTASVQAIGGLLTANYYHSGSFRGVWGQVGAGVHSLSATTPLGTESAISPTFIATIGYRGYWDMGLNIGVGAGLQYVKDPDFVAVAIRSTGVKPLFVLDIGINF